VIAIARGTGRDAHGNGVGTEELQCASPPWQQPSSWDRLTARRRPTGPACLGRHLLQERQRIGGVACRCALRIVPMHHARDHASGERCC
jgi:hypothetical protein